TPNLPSSLSRTVVTDILKNEMGFKGLVFTDAMDMKGVVKYFKDGEADVRAIIAGNDVLELSENSKQAIKMVRRAIRKGRIDKREIEARVKKVLAAKYWLGLEDLKPVSLSNLYPDLNRNSAKQLNQELADNSITLLKGKEGLSQIDFTRKTAIVSIGTNTVSTFQQILGERFDNAFNFIVSSNSSELEIEKAKSEINSYEQVIVALHDARARPGSILNYNAAVKTFVSELANQNASFILFGNPYALASLPGIEHSNSLLVAYQNDDIMQRAGARVILKEISAKGKLPVTINSFFRYGDGL